MTLRQLETLYAILRTGSITAAARSLHITQPAVSAVLKHTEQQLGMPLFERQKGRLVPTPEALRLLPDLEEIFGRIETVSRMVDDLRDGRAGQLVVATSPTLVNSLLPRAIAALRERSRFIKVSIHSLPTPLAVLRVARREADFGLVYGPVDDPLVEPVTLLQTHIACVVPKWHRLAGRDIVAAEDLKDESVISTGSRTRLGTLIEDACLQHGQEPPVIGIEASSSMAACQMVSCGAGIALVDQTTALGYDYKDLAFKPFSPEIRIEIQMIFPIDRPRSRATNAMTEWLLSEFGNVPG
ncbi:MAG TPA: LysR family transcriptional regulator [Ramlibacter sp.]|nr:LysR family transcriptional regulator [Ramlibacter sp.]